MKIPIAIVLAAPSLLPVWGGSTQVSVELSLQIANLNAQPVILGRSDPVLVTGNGAQWRAFGTSNGSLVTLDHGKRVNSSSYGIKAGGQAPVIVAGTLACDGRLPEGCQVWPTVRVTFGSGPARRIALGADHCVVLEEGPDGTPVCAPCEFTYELNLRTGHGKLALK